jgi:hypothetical protein
VDVQTSLRRRHLATGRLLPALLLAASLVLNGCPMTPLIGSAKNKGSAGEDPGPPTVLNPSLLDRG